MPFPVPTVFTIVAVPVVFTIVPFPIVIPVVIVRNPAAISLPVAFEKAVAVVMGTNPMRTGIRCPGPISVMPFVVVSYRIPVALDPKKIGSWTRRQNPHHAGRRWWADSYSYRNLSAQHRAAG
jgi:hypothetical protein